MGLSTTHIYSCSKRKDESEEVRELMGEGGVEVEKSGCRVPDSERLSSVQA